MRVVPRLAFLWLTLVALSLSSQAADLAFSRQAFTDIEAHRGKLSDVVTVTGPSKTIFVWGVGAEDEDSTTQYTPNVRFRGNFAGQCDYALDKIGRMLATRGATVADVTVLRAYLTDGRNTGDFYKCLDRRLGSMARPAVTVANISQLAHVGMLVEIEATASVPDTGNARFAITRNVETLGKWNLGATEVLEVAGPDRTIYLSGLHAIAKRSGEILPVALSPQDFVSQCAFVQKKMKADLVALGAAIDNVVRSTTFVTGDVRQPDSAKCRSQLPKQDLVRVPGTLLNVPQLSALGETFTYDVIAMAPLRAGDEDMRFSMVSVPSDVDPSIAGSVAVSGPRRTLYLSGVGAQDEADGTAVQFKGDFVGQCRIAVQKIGTTLAKRGAALSDVAKMLVFVTDSRYLPEYRRCMAEAFGGAVQPAQTFVNVARLPISGMLIQIDAIAATAP